MIGLITHILVLVQIAADLHFRRGPFHLSEGKFIGNYKDETKFILDLLRLIFALLLFIDYQIPYLIIPYLIV